MNDEDDLLDRYRRASAAESSRPSDAARSAIAARARVAAAVRTLPAANDTHWRLRAAAGVAVVAVGAFIVHRLSQDRQFEQQVVEQKVAARIAQPVVDAAPEPPVSTEPAPAVAQRSTTSAPPAEMADAAPKSEVTVAAAPAMTAAVASAGADSAAVSTRAAAITAAVLTRYFPDAFSASGTAPPMWLLIDQNGRVVRSGRFASIEETRLRTHLEQFIPGARIGEYQTVTVSDAKQRQATVAIVTLVHAESRRMPGSR